MTINSLQLNTSTPFTGLGTQTFNVVTTGLYTVGLNVTIPWMTSDQPIARANPETMEVQTITAVADVSGSLNSTYWTFNSAGDNTGYYVWYNINSAGVDPAVTGRTGIAVAGATNATASTLGGATRAAIAAATSLVAVTGATTATILTNTQYGNTTAAADGVAATGFAFSVGTAGTYGYASGLSIVVKKNTTTIMTLNQPAPTQPMMGGSVVVSATAGDTITVITSSLAAADSIPNAVKGIINLFQGE